MYNPFKIYQLSKVLWNREKNYNHYQEEGISAADVAVGLNTQFEFPSNLRLITWFRSTKRGCDVLWGRNDKSVEYQRDHIIPVITDKKKMKEFPPNTVGGHYQHLIKQWSFEELWNRRFAHEDEGWRAEVRSNVSRHVFLCHDFQHVMFRYDTTQMGEACIQAVTAVMTKHFGPWYAARLIALRMCFKFNSLEPMRILNEAFRLAKATKKEFWLINPLEIIHMDVEEARSKYNVGVPVRYLKFAEEHKDDFRFDSIHPEYNDAVATIELSL